MPEEIEKEEIELPEVIESEDNTPDFLEIIEDNETVVFEEEEEEAEKPKKSDTRFQRRIDELRAKQGVADTALEQERRKNVDLERRLRSIEDGVGQKDQLELQYQYTNTKAALTQAVEEGNTERQIELTEMLTDIRAKARTAEASKTQTPLQDEEGRLPATVKAPEAPPPKEAMLWWNRNRWFNGPQFSSESTVARKIDATLEAEGFDREDKSYYEELDNRLQAEHPELYKGAEMRKKQISSPTKGATLTRKSKAKDGRIIMTKSQLQIGKELQYSTKEEWAAYASELAREAANG
tara:strand:+ start:1324 stop:2208 length:885 start_codon:yes stop_codon:yes gene_type:complete